MVSQATIGAVRRMNPQIRVVARLSDTEFLKDFAQQKVNNLVYPEFEAGLEMTRQALLQLGLPVQEVHQYTKPLRQEFFRQGDRGDRLIQEYRTLAQLRTAEQSFDLEYYARKSGSQRRIWTSGDRHRRVIKRLLSLPCSVQ